MEKNKIQNFNQCYIVSLDNGIREEEPIYIDVVNNFSDGSQLVQLNKTVYGLYRSNSLNPDTMYIDDYEIIKADIAELLDIDHEEKRRIVNDDKNVGIFTTLNHSKYLETRISATTILNHMVEYVNNGIISEEDKLWISETFRLPETTKGNPIKDPRIIENIINLGLYSIIKDIEIKSGKPLEDKPRDYLRKSYIRMILFDYLIGRKYRCLDYYIITPLTESGTEDWSQARFAPISISNSIEKDELLEDNEYILNNKIVDKNVLLTVLFEKFYKEIKKTSEALNEATRLYDDALGRIIYNNTDVDSAMRLEDQIDINLAAIIKKQQEKETALDKEHKINKIEKTMATQSLNVRVTAKLELIQKKYPINPKKHPELLKQIKNTKKEKENNEIKLVVEKERKHNSGFATSTVLVSAVALICGIATGIAYVIMTFGN